MTTPIAGVSDDASTELTGKKPAPELSDHERDFYQAYYLLQSQRQSQHETNRLAVSNFILAGSLAALGFTAGKKGLAGWVVGTVLFSVLVVNVLAVLYARQSRYWVKVHQARASRVLKQLSPELIAMQDEVRSISRKDMLAKKSGNGSFQLDAFRSERLQSSIHLIVVVGITVYLGFAISGGI